MSVLKKISEFIKKEPLFAAAAICALLSALFVKPDIEYLRYPDYRSLSLIFCLMAVIAGLQSIGVFSILGQELLRLTGTLKSLGAALVFLCFFFAMFITNDVALITFVPFTILIYKLIGREEKILKTVVLETIAANLGSMATPIGNPQNIYLYSMSDISAGSFFGAVIPYSIIAAFLLAAVLLSEKKEKVSLRINAENNGVIDKYFKRKLFVYSLLFLLCIFVVFKILPFIPVTVIILLAICIMDKKVLKSIDYFLLLTFFCFFIFVGNIKRIDIIYETLNTLVSGRELFWGILLSQIISNVPAAVLLSAFTKDYPLLLTAVNIGGLGTLIASLASLISYKYYVKAYPDKGRGFLKVFTGWNLLFLTALLVFALVLTS